MPKQEFETYPPKMSVLKWLNKFSGAELRDLIVGPTAITGGTAIVITGFFTLSNVGAISVFCVAAVTAVIITTVLRYAQY